jgi:hypothetical protein
MGHDLIIYFGNHESFYDWDLWALRHFFLAEAKAINSNLSDDDTRAAVSFFDRWSWEGPGVVTGISFEDYADTPARLEILRCVLQGASNRIESFGETIPLSYLQANCPEDLIRYTEPQPTRYFREQIDRMFDLLNRPRKGGRRPNYRQLFAAALERAKNTSSSAPVKCGQDKRVRRLILVGIAALFAVIACGFVVYLATRR